MVQCSVSVLELALKSMALWNKENNIKKYVRLTGGISFPPVQPNKSTN